MNVSRQLSHIGMALDKLYSALGFLETNEGVDPDTLAALREAIGLLENDESHLAAEISAHYQDK